MSNFWPDKEELMRRATQQQQDVSYKLDLVLRELQVAKRLLLTLVSDEERLMATLDDLQAQVSANVSAEASAITLIKGIAQQLADAGNDPAKLSALQDQLKNSADALAAAVVENTPASA